MRRKAPARHQMNTCQLMRTMTMVLKNCRTQILSKSLNDTSANTNSSITGYLIVRGYYAPLPDGEDVYVDFFYTDEDLDGNDDAPIIADFDQKVAEEYPMFLRKRMPARLLLKILKKQQEASQA
ncbi:hypothetical protein PF585_07330 [Lactobacillus delbrueckii]|nr:hypothetical protein [Lactobacillus delbrueckii]